MRSFALASLVGLAVAQTTQLLNFTLDIGQVDPVERSNWCSGERNTCQALCPGKPKDNSCEPSNLAFTCTCSNGTAPGLEFYDQSLFSFVCRESFNQCNENNAGDAAELKKCVDDIRNHCGTLTIDNPEPTSTSDSDSTSDADAGKTTADSGSSSSKADSFAAPTAFPGKGAAVVAIGLAAALL